MEITSPPETAGETNVEVEACHHMTAHISSLANGTLTGPLKMYTLAHAWHCGKCGPALRQLRQASEASEKVLSTEVLPAGD